MVNQVGRNEFRRPLRRSQQRNVRGASFDALNQQRPPAFSGALERAREDGIEPPQQNEPTLTNENVRSGLSRARDFVSRAAQDPVRAGDANLEFRSPVSPQLRNVVQSAVSDQREASQEAALDNTITSAQEVIQNRGTESPAQTLDEREVELRRQAGEENPIGSGALAEQEAQQRRNPQGLRRINREDLRQGLADGSLGTFSVEGRDSRTLRSARDAAGIGPDGSLVFDQRGLARLGNRLSVSSPAPGNEITPDQRINDQEALGLISAEQAAGQRARLTAQESTAAEFATAGGGGQGQQSQQSALSPEAREDIAGQTNALLQRGEDDPNRITSDLVGIFQTAAARSNSLPEGFGGTDLAGAIAFADIVPGIKQGINIPFVNDDVSQPLSPEPVFDLFRDIATSDPGRTKFNFGGQEIDLSEDIPARTRTLMNQTVESLRRSFADSAAQTFFQETSSGKSAEEAKNALTPSERKVAEAEFERTKQQNVAQLRQRFLQQNQNRTLRERQQGASAGDGQLSPFSPEQQAQLEAAENQDFDEFLAQRAAGILNGQR